MSQNEIYEILKNKRLSGIDKFYSQQQLTSLLLDGKITEKFIGSTSAESVNRDLKRLHAFGILDKCSIKGKSHYRIKAKVLDES